MKNILLISKNEGAAIELRNRLMQRPGMNVKTVNTSQDAMKIIATQKMDLMILHLSTVSQKNFQILIDFRELGYQIPLLVTSPVIALDVFDLIKKIESAVLLEVPAEDKDLFGITEKLMNGVDVAQRVHRRYYTNQFGTVESFEDGEVIPTTLFNLSKGGAHVTFGNSDVSLKKGDLVRLNVQLDEVGKQHQVNGTVVWIQPDAKKKTPASAGIEFLSAGEVYRKLLMNV